MDICELIDIKWTDEQLTVNLYYNTLQKQSWSHSRSPYIEMYLRMSLSLTITVFEFPPKES